jgi:hypothetical protein
VKEYPLVVGFAASVAVKVCFYSAQMRSVDDVVAGGGSSSLAPASLVPVGGATPNLRMAAHFREYQRTALRKLRVYQYHLGAIFGGIK